jgi:hypothetical protein
MTQVTANNVQNLVNSVFIRLNLKGDWFVLTDVNGATFNSLDEAIDFVRANNLLSGNQIELSHFNQAMLGNAQWDNL